MGVLYQTNGEIKGIAPADGKYFSLEEMQKLVGGDIQMLPAGQSQTIVCAEEGKLLGMPRNPMATTAYKMHLLPEDYLVGNVLIASNDELED